MAASALTGLRHLDWQTPVLIETVVRLFAIGGFVAFPLGLFAASLLAGARRGGVAFASAFVSLTTATLGVTALLSSPIFHTRQPDWSADDPAMGLLGEIAVAIAAPVYQFAVLGLRLYFPLGFIALVIASLWFARRPD